MSTPDQAPAPLTWVPVKSSNIASVAYDEAGKSLHIRFNGGAEWAYADVLPSTYQDFIDTASKGQFFNSRIKHFFAGTKIAG